VLKSKLVFFIIYRSRSYNWRSLGRITNKEVSVLDKFAVNLYNALFNNFNYCFVWSNQN